MTLQLALQYVLHNYKNARKNTFSGHKLANFIRHNLPDKITPILYENDINYIIKGSPGIGRWADVPWLAIYNQKVTNTAQSGFYIVYLFDVVNNKIFLSLNQGTVSIRKQYKKNTHKVLEASANLFRCQLIEFKHKKLIKEIPYLDGKLGSDYKAGHIIGFEYANSKLPNEKTLIEDLKLIIKAYNQLSYNTDNLLHPTPKAQDKNQEHAEETRLYKERLVLQRNSNIIQKVKDFHGTKCQCCGLDFFEKYGEIGKGFIEVHHKKELSKLPIGYKTEYSFKEDYATLCSNCHRMIHRTKDPSNVEYLKNLINKNKT